MIRFHSKKEERREWRKKRFFSSKFAQNREINQDFWATFSYLFRNTKFFALPLYRHLRKILLASLHPFVNCLFTVKQWTDFATIGWSCGSRKGESFSVLLLQRLKRYKTFELTPGVSQLHFIWYLFMGALGAEILEVACSTLFATTWTLTTPQNFYWEKNNILKYFRKLCSKVQLYIIEISLRVHLWEHVDMQRQVTKKITVNK